jgi:diguanylate cyclase (GGDEF)-like protein
MSSSSVFAPLRLEFISRLGRTLAGNETGNPDQNRAATEQVPVVTPGRLWSLPRLVRLLVRGLEFDDPQLEEEFRGEDWRAVLLFARICFASGALLWALFAVLDILVAPTNLTALWIIRFGIGWPTLLLALALTFIPSMQPRLQTAGITVGSVCAICIIAMVGVTVPPASHLYYVGIILVVTYSYTFGLMRFAHAIPYGLAVLAVYEVVVIAVVRAPIYLIVNNNFFLISSIYIGIFACYTMERHRRQNFLQRTQLAELTAQLEDLSVHDPLTGLYNRRQLAEHLEAAMGLHERHGMPAAIMLIDLDDFKEINDRFGHLAGDELLRRTARVITATIRRSDVAFRYGGDEFLVLLPDTILEAAEDLAERLVGRVMSFGRSDGGFENAAGISVGVAAITGGISRPEDLLVAADRALYAAKLQGKGCVVVGGAGDS